MPIPARLAPAHSHPSDVGTFLVPEAYDTPQLLEFVFGLEPYAARDAFGALASARNHVNVDALIIGTVRRLERVLGERLPTPSAGLGVSWGAPS